LAGTGSSDFRPRAFGRLSFLPTGDCRSRWRGNRENQHPPSGRESSSAELGQHLNRLRTTGSMMSTRLSRHPNACARALGNPWCDHRAVGERHSRAADSSGALPAQLARFYGEPFRLHVGSGRILQLRRSVPLLCRAQTNYNRRSWGIPS